MNGLYIIMPIIVGLSISIPIVIDSQSGGTHFTQHIDSRISKVTNGFVIASDMDIYSITVEDEIQGLSIAISSKSDGFIQMDDPLPILQKLFPENNIVSIAVLSRGIEIPYTLGDGKLGISVNNSHSILIIGYSKT